MKNIYRLAAMAAALFALTACGGVHNTVITEPSNGFIIEQTTLLPVSVKSRETNKDAQALNAKWKSMAESQLRTLLNNENIKIVKDSTTTVNCTIDVTYGNQALRYFVGFGAGSGHINVTIEMRDANGEVLYATKSEADLAVGFFGGNMSSVANKTIESAVQEFGSKL